MSKRSLVNTIPVMGNHDQDMVAMLRNKFRCTLAIAQADDATLVLAYTAWRLADGRDWQTLPKYLRKTAREATYAHAHAMQREQFVAMFSLFVTQRHYDDKRPEAHVWEHWAAVAKRLDIAA